MAWLRVDDGFVENPKIADLKDRSFRLHMAALCYCARNLTDGKLTDRAVRVTLAIVSATRKNVAELVEADLWLPQEDGFLVKDYTEYNPTAEEVKEKRAKNSRRQGIFRNPDLRRAVRERDGDQCRYCGVTVNWNDRKGVRGGTYDHVDPNGDNSLENLVVACRSCNSQKGSRTPAEARMALRGPHQNLDTDLDLDQASDQVRGNPPSPPVPTPGVSDLSALPRPQPVDGHEEVLWRRLCSAAGARTRPDVEKLERTVRARRSTEREIVCAIEAATGPGVKDPLAVALAELVKRNEERNAA